MVSLISMIGSSTIKNAFPVASQKNIHIVSYSISARFPMSGGLIDKLTNEQIQKKTPQAHPDFTVSSFTGGSNL